MPVKQTMAFQHDVCLCGVRAAVAQEAREIGSWALSQEGPPIWLCQSQATCGWGGGGGVWVGVWLSAGSSGKHSLPNSGKVVLTPTSDPVSTPLPSALRVQFSTLASACLLTDPLQPACHCSSQSPTSLPGDTSMLWKILSLDLGCLSSSFLFFANSYWPSRLSSDPFLQEAFQSSRLNLVTSSEAS